MVTNYLDPHTRYNQSLNRISTFVTVYFNNKMFITFLMNLAFKFLNKSRLINQYQHTKQSPA